MSSEAESAVDRCLGWCEGQARYNSANIEKASFGADPAWIADAKVRSKETLVVVEAARAELSRLRLRVSELEAALRGLLDMSESDAADFDHQIAFDECMEAARHQARRALRNEEGAKKGERGG